MEKTKISTDKEGRWNLAREIWGHIREAGVKADRLIHIYGSKSKPKATVFLPYDGRLVEMGDAFQPNRVLDEETFDEQTERLAKDRKIVNNIMRGYSFSRTKHPAYADRLGLVVKVPYFFDPEIQ